MHILHVQNVIVLSSFEKKIANSFFYIHFLFYPNKLVHFYRLDQAGISILEQNLPKNMKVPNKYLPTFNAMFMTGVIVTIHVLVVLLQVWLVKFKLFMNYTFITEREALDQFESSSSSSSSSYATDLVACATSQVGAKPSLSTVIPCEQLGLTFVYGRRTFVLEETDDADDSSQEFIWNKISPPKSFPLTHFHNWDGHTDKSASLALTMFGPNHTNVECKSFKDLYLEQLVSPLTVFQLFCTLLWCLDSYLTYSLFSLGMILMFEGTVVFQRMKSVQALSKKPVENQPTAISTFRNETWEDVPMEELVPGDVCKLTADAVEIPADCIVLKGQCVVNEASLTGESVPQFREEVSIPIGDSGSAEDVLDTKGPHKNNTLFAGTKLLQSSQELRIYILRTGFCHTGGKLVRMMEQSQNASSRTSSVGESSTSGSRDLQSEVGYLLAFLLLFAIISAGYVLQHGRAILAADGTMDHKVQYKLLLHCILILTSVIPPELPMQMSLTINSSLMKLMKGGIFCTDPQRVPTAGMLDVALFDKTGTLTTDELVVAGMAYVSEGNLKGMGDIQGASKLVISGCHTLFSVEDKIQGDPLELAAYKSIRWALTSRPNLDKEQNGDETIMILGPRPAVAEEMIDGKVTKKAKPAGEAITLESSNTKVSSVQILQRHHFSSALQRMSCVVANTHTNDCYTVAKGSPEAILQHCLSNESIDRIAYTETATSLAKKGYRVIALAYKQLHNELEHKDAMRDRSLCESGLTFAGFLCFTCRVRKDTKEVLRALREGGIGTRMITGDAMLTAAHVARQVDMVPNGAKLALLELDGSWTLEKDCNGESTAKLDEDLTAELIYDLSTKYKLCTSGKALPLLSFDRSTVQYFTVFARCKPQDKEWILESLQSSVEGYEGQACGMCGDGANDVGALRGADVGVALLSGFGDVNVEKDVDEKDSTNKNSTSTAIISADEMSEIQKWSVKKLKSEIRSFNVDPDNYRLTSKSELVQLYRKTRADNAVRVMDRKKIVDPKLAKREAAQRKAEDQKQRLMKRVQELEEAGESWATFKAMREFMAEEQKKAKENRKKTSTVSGSAAAMIQQMEDLDMDDTPTIQIGDASMAAPFTSKLPSIRSMADVVRQGRCTLVTSMQMYQILALNSLISAYSLSVLYLDGVKYGDVQMTGMGILMSIVYMSVSRSTPLKKLSPVKPLTSIFHPSLFLSLLLQFTTHLSTMVYAVYCAKLEKSDEEMEEKIDLDGEFKPGIVNSVVFLVSCVQQVAVFVVNLQGRPFMTGLTENRPLLYSLIATFILTFMFASETVPSLNKYMQLVPFPSDDFRNFILILLAADVFLCFAFDRLMKLFFAPKILFASMAEVGVKDVIKLGRTIVVILFIMHLLLGDDEQWEELMREEGRLEGEADGLLASNITDGDGTIEHVNTEL